jgi:hypothetical protein
MIYHDEYAQRVVVADCLFPSVLLSELALFCSCQKLPKDVRKDYDRVDLRENT